MCGINGFSWEDKKLIKDMNSALSHRGPDQQGIFLDKNISLGHKRLSIIDLSIKGKQPMCNEDGSIWIVFNGEIYNHHKIRHALEEAGHKFASNCDTEAIIHAYEEYGYGCVSLLRGMFAFAIYDSKEKKIFVVRDRLGIKPLYYANTRKGLIFSSEIKSILQDRSIKRQISLGALHDYLSFRCVSLEQTMFEGIRKLAPGHYLVYKNKKTEIRKFWDFSMVPEKMSESFAAKKVYDLLKQSVEERLMSDVPLGVYVSGGIDSGTVVGLMDQVVDSPIETFTVGFGIEEHEDELAKARVITDYFDTNHHEIIVDPRAAHILPRLVWHMDEPMCDPTSIPTYYLAQQTKPKCTVVLTGEGGDETFAGYVQYKMMALHNNYVSQVPKPLRQLAVPLAKIAPKPVLNSIFKYAEGLGEQGINRFAQFLSSDDKAEQYLSLVSIFSEDEKKELFSNKNFGLMDKMNLTGRLSSYFSKKSLLNNLLKLETKILLPENLLMKVDKNTMAFAVEARVPFLSHPVVEFCSKIPPRLKINGNVEKYILRRAMKGIVPKETLMRKKERFFVPINFRFQGELMDISKQLLSKETIKKDGIFNYSYIEKVFNGFDKSKIFYSRQLWSLIIFQLWKKMYIDDNILVKPRVGLKALL